MKAKRVREGNAASPPPVEVSSADRALLIDAFKAGLIAAWKRDPEHGYRLTRAGGPDEYVEVMKLASHLAKLKGAA